MKPATGAYLFCRGTPVRVGKRSCVVSVEQRNDQDELVTVALFNFVVAQNIDPIVVEPKHPALKF